MVKFHSKSHNTAVMETPASQPPELSEITLPTPPILSNIESINVCLTCSKDFVNNDCIGCTKCNAWFHPKCISLKNTHFNALCALAQSVDWFCSSCSVDRHLNEPETISGLNTPDIAASILAKLENLCSTVDYQATAILQLQTSHNKPATTTPSSSQQTMQHPPTKQGSSYAEIMKKHIKQDFSRSSKASTDNTVSVAKKLPPKENVLVLSGGVDKTKVFGHASMLKELSLLFPRIKLVHSSTKPNGLIFLAFSTKEDAQKVFDGWTSTYIGTNTKINFYQEGNNKSVIIKNVPVSISESDLLNSISEQYSSCKSVKRFIKNGTALQVIQVAFDAITDFDAILENGVFIDSLFLTCDKFVQLRQPTRCFNCNSFGHTASNCRGKTTCGKCGNSHRTTECESDIKKCKNCDGPHAAFDKRCPRYIELLNKMNSSFL